LNSSVPCGSKRGRRRVGCATALWAAILFCLCVPPSSPAQCGQLKARDILWLRLLVPVSSYAGKAGDTIRAMVIDSPPCEDRPTIAPGSVISGEIKSVRRVGMGFVHETASVEIEFNRLETADGEISISTRLLEVDNAREKVKGGVIRGVNATDTLQGRITSRLKHLPTWNPYSDLTLFAYRVAFPVFPEPEIYLPRGSDVKLELAASAVVPLAAGQPTTAPSKESALLAMAGPILPARTTTPSGRDADVLNMALIGSDRQMDAAFHAAGWEHGDKTSIRSVLREMHAFLALKNYPRAPISPQLVDGMPVTTTWEKGLDSYEKREHLRLWVRSDLLEGQTVWLGAMTRETGATLSVKRHKFIHHIDPDLDVGRAVLVRDLDLAGCVASVDYFARPEAAHPSRNATGDPMRSDGLLAVVQLKDCENPLFEQEAVPAVATRPRSKIARYLRMEVLSFRSDVVRANLLYGAFDLTRMAIRARRTHRERIELARKIQLAADTPRTVQNVPPTGGPPQVPEPATEFTGLLP
jgi:hypothetical protein